MSPLLLCLAALLPGSQADGLPAAQRRGVAYLLQHQYPDGTWRLPGHERFAAAGAACLGLALLQAGLPREHLALWQVDRHLAAHPPHFTYDAALRVQFLLAYRPDDLDARLARAAQALPLPRAEYYGYPSPGGSVPGDLSNHQFALLSLDLLHEHGLGPDRNDWKDMTEFLLRHQRAGGWGYLAGHDPGPTMTLAGLACLAACRRALDREGIGGRLAREVDEALEAGLARAGRGWFLNAPRDHAPLNRWVYYAGATLERVMALTGREQLGDHAWYPEVARFLLAEQNDNGSWSSASGEPVVNTALALLTLTRATAATGDGGSTEPLWAHRWRNDEGELTLVASGHDPCTAFVAAVPGARAEGWLFPDEVTPRLEGVRWFLDDTLLGTSHEARGVLRFPLQANGTFTLRAEATLQVPGAGAQPAERLTLSAALPLHVTGLVDDRARQEDGWRRRALVLPTEAVETWACSSAVGGEVGVRWALDGHQGTAWRWQRDDAAPWWECSFDDRPRIAGLRLLPDLPSDQQADDVAQAARVRVSVGRRDFELVLEAGHASEGVHLAFRRPIRARSLRVEVLELHPDNRHRSGGFREIQLLRE